MRNFVRGLLTIFCLSVSSAYAIFPDSGWYWNPNQSGRGFNIEIQNNVLFLSAFTYANGQPIWYVSSGTMSSDRNFTGRLLQTTGGQCFGCAYSAPSVSDVGAISIAFSNETHAVLTLPGETISVQRQGWAGYTASPDALFGEWSTTEGGPVFPVFSVDRISFSVPFLSSGVNYAQGNRTGSSSNIALGAYNANLNSWLVLLDSSTSYYRAYQFQFTGLNRIEGQYWLYLKTSTLSGPGTYFVAHRTKSQARVKGGSAPGIAKSAPLQSVNTKFGQFDFLQEENARLRATQNSEGPLPFDIRIIQALETALKASSK